MEQKAAISGLALVNKEKGMTSQTVVTRLRHILGAEKAGHTGTLDPMAEGVLPVLVGRAVKASEFLLTGDKHYSAELLLGTETDTEDVTGTVLTTSSEIPAEARVREVCATFLGEGEQVPPMYSAIRVGGRRLMELAREGKTVEREARPITVYSLDVTRLSDKVYRLDVVCSKGTYIRTLCADIGRALGCGGCMQALCRTEAAGYPLAAAHTLSEWEGMSEGERQAALIPVEGLFADCEAVTLPPFFARLAHNGLPIYLKKIGRVDPLGTRLRLCDENGFFALGEVRAEAEGVAVRPIRQF
ncbi:MAG: tRNA pseudouridine(55) synthase TruB [Clostridia bacterium]|nr:tRNA pseudouridine(55) synthase TruB [Clostridia bacterium]